MRGTDPDGDALAYTVSAQPAHGRVVLDGANFIYTPAANYNGADQFSFYADDGKISSTPATIRVNVTAINDAPVIDAIIGPAELDGRSSTSFIIMAHDVDGDPVSVSVQQVGGDPVQVVMTGNTFSVVVPDLQAVDTLALRASASDGAMETSRHTSLRLLPLSPSGMLRTIRGSRVAPGLHLIVTGDGYVAAEQGLLRADARMLATAVVDAADVGMYAAAWNVHVLDQVSVESGVDHPTQGIARDTAYDGTLDCSGVERLLCVDTGKVLDAVVPEFPAYSQILVTSNTDIYGGGGGTISVTSRNLYAPLVALHEMGHTFARLVDEYIDTQLDTGPIAGFEEDLVRNATEVTDPAMVKWRHWFTNPAAVPHLDHQAGVGLFPGSYYRASGYYRPTFNSFMRTTTAEMGAVNAEQWIKSIYQAVGAVRSVTPGATTLALPAGARTVFAVTPMFGGALQQTRWYEDGEEIASARGALTYACCAAASGTRTVKLVVVDITGKIKDSAPGPALYQRTWQVSFN
jgi:hypothetical protein